MTREAYNSLMSLLLLVVERLILLSLKRLFLFSKHLVGSWTHVGFVIGMIALATSVTWESLKNSIGEIVNLWLNLMPQEKKILSDRKRKSTQWSLKVPTQVKLMMSIHVSYIDALNLSFRVGKTK